MNLDVWGGRGLCSSKKKLGLLERVGLWLPRSPEQWMDYIALSSPGAIFLSLLWCLSHHTPQMLVHSAQMQQKPFIVSAPRTSLLHLGNAPYLDLLGQTFSQSLTDASFTISLHLMSTFLFLLSSSSFTSKNEFHDGLMMSTINRQGSHTMNDACTDPYSRLPQIH